MGLKVKLAFRNSTPLVISPYQGPQAGLNCHIEAFIQWRKANRLPSSHYPTFNLLFGPPKRSGEINLALAVGMDGETLLRVRQSARQQGFEEGRLPGTSYACLQLEEYQMPEGIHFLLQHWLPNSGYQAMKHPLVVERFVGEGGQGIELSLPLAE